MAKELIFLRKATGLVRAWGFFDVFSFNSYANPMIGYYTSFVVLYAAFWPAGHLLPAIVISTVFATVQSLVYAMLVTTMPRAGGEYVWMSRIFPSPIVGFVLVLVGWVFVVLLWFALLAPAICGLFFQPIALALGNMDAAQWFMTADGLAFGSIWFIIAGWPLIILGMKWCGRFIRSSYVLGGLIATGITMVTLLLFTRGDFISAYNTFHANNFGLTNAFQGTLSTVESWGAPYWPIPGFLDWDLAATLPLLALVAYANSWSMWGSPMYGEVRGASEMKVTFWSMGGANFLNNGLMILFLLVWVNLVGYDFFQASNLLYGSAVYGGYVEAAVPLWPSPVLFLYILTGSPILTLIVAIFGVYYITVVHGLCCVYLPAMRMLFAMSFDRILPGPLAKLSTKRNIPIVALTVCGIIGLLYTWLYFYVPGFVTLTLMGTVVLILSFMGATIAAIFLPLKLPEAFKASAASKYKIGGVPLISICGAVTFGFFLYLCYNWITDATFGVNDPKSVWFFVAVYIGAIILYLFMKYYRKSQGIDISVIAKEVPVE